MQKIKELLENQFNVKVTINGSVLKLRTPRLSARDLVFLSDLYTSNAHLNGLEVIRSGAGLTVLVGV